MNKSKSGFTIVELLIVIVVIAILAAISVVAYNGIQTRARNSQTIQAATAWFKAFKAYEAEHGELPHTGYDSCLGENYPWDFEENTSGNNQCFYSSGSYYYIRPSLGAALSPYMGGQLPSPSMQTIGTSTSWGRGLLYQTPSVGGQFRLTVVLAGIDTCPLLNGVNASQAARAGGITCAYPLGTRLR